VIIVPSEMNIGAYRHHTSVVFRFLTALLLIYKIT